MFYVFLSAELIYYDTGGPGFRRLRDDPRGHQPSFGHFTKKSHEEYIINDLAQGRGALRCIRHSFGLSEEAGNKVKLNTFRSNQKNNT